MTGAVTQEAPCPLRECQPPLRSKELRGRLSCHSRPARRPRSVAGEPHRHLKEKTRRVLAEVDLLRPGRHGPGPLTWAARATAERSVHRSDAVADVRVAGSLCDQRRRLGLGRAVLPGAGSSSAGGSARLLRGEGGEGGDEVEAAADGDAQSGDGRDPGGHASGQRARVGVAGDQGVSSDGQYADGGQRCGHADAEGQDEDDRVDRAPGEQPAHKDDEGGRGRQQATGEGEGEQATTGPGVEMVVGVSVSVRVAVVVGVSVPVSVPVSVCVLRLGLVRGEMRAVVLLVVGVWRVRTGAVPGGGRPGPVPGARQGGVPRASGCACARRPGGGTGGTSDGRRPR